MKAQFPTQIRSVLMVDPQYFDVEYAINPFMRDTDGQLHKVDRSLARKQWLDLKATFEGLNLKVHVLPGQPGFPDMVFCANQSFPFLSPNGGSPNVLLSRMRAPQRAGEVSFFEKWFQTQNCAIHNLQDGESSFESNGDVIPVPGSDMMWGGVGPRTDRKVYEELTQKFELKVHTLDLVHPNFYHLDTCFFVVNRNLCAYVQEAFSTESVEKIEKHFAETLQIPLNEGLQYFAGNAFCPDGKNVILQKGATATNEKLKSYGMNVIEVETSEYMKSGGSVFCMKLALPF